MSPRSWTILSLSAHLSTCTWPTKSDSWSPTWTTTRQWRCPDPSLPSTSKRRKKTHDSSCPQLARVTSSKKRPLWMRDLAAKQTSKRSKRKTKSQRSPRSDPAPHHRPRRAVAPARAAPLTRRRKRRTKRRKRTRISSTQRILIWELSEQRSSCLESRSALRCQTDSSTLQVCKTAALFLSWVEWTHSLRTRSILRAVSS